MNMPAPPVALNPYKAPVSEVVDGQHENALLYVVAPRKFLTLLIGTVGAYAVYWFYCNWAALNRVRGGIYWPVPRAIFAIFFTHALFKEVDATLQREGKTFPWSASGTATLYVASSVISSVIGRVTSGTAVAPFMSLLSLALMVPMFYALYRAQLAINMASGDEGGTGNSEMSFANIAWIVAGALLWLSVLFGLFVLLTGRVHV
jgi:hypothetical protein